MNIGSILLAILIFGLLILIHELGHFCVARLFGVKILEFAIGMGPRLFGIRSKKTGTLYSLRLFPIGGYVSMYGETGMELAQGDNGEKQDTAEQNASVPEQSKDSFFLNSTEKGEPTEEEKPNEIPDPHSFANLSVWKRLLILLAGPMMNIFLGFVLMLGLVIAGGQTGALTTTIGGFFLNYSGDPTESGLKPGDQITYIDGYQINSLDGLRQVIDENETGFYDVYLLRSDAATNEISEIHLSDIALDASFADRITLSLSGQSGLQIGDRVLKVNKTSVHTYNELSYEIMNQGYKPVNLTVLRNGEKVVLESVVFPSVTESGVTVGMTDFKIYIVDRFDVGTVLKYTWYRSLSTVKMVYDSLFGLVSGKYGVEAVSGPVGITKTVSTAAKAGLETLVYLMTVISINLGVVNLLPFPALDGGHIFIYLVEAVRRKPIKKELEGIINFVGLAILLSLSLLIAIKDVINL